MRRKTWIVLFICCSVIAAAAGALTATWLVGHHPTAQPVTGQHVTVLPKASCGSATTHRIDGQTQVLVADRGALTCFDAAVRGCKPASIELVEMGVDTGTMDVFTAQRDGSACQVTELTQWYSANGGGSTGPVNSVTCSGAAVTGRGVTLACGGQNVLIPSAVTSGPAW